MKIATMVGPRIKCNCGCKKTYFRGGWKQHYLRDVMPVSLARFVNGTDTSGLVRDVNDPRNFERA
jgi:hypothetical protein